MTPTATPVTYGLDLSLARFSLASYQRMIEAGVFTSEDKVELLENYVVLKMARNPPHDGTVQLVTEALPARIPSGWLPRVLQTWFCPIANRSRILPSSVERPVLI